MRTIDLSTWKRRQHFELYRGSPNPFWSVTADVDVDRLVGRCRAPRGPSFPFSCLWLALKAVHECEEMRLRIRGDEVVLHERIHVTSTVLRPDDTFVFGYFDYVDDYRTFEREGREQVRRLRRADGDLLPRWDRDDLIYNSILPWLSFSAFSHARTAREEEDSIPRLVFGKHRPVEGRRRMPLSVQVHHGLVDGLHVGRFVERFEELLQTGPPES